MKKSIAIIGITLSFSFFNLHANEAFDKGKALSDKHCQSCHQSEIYTRPDHRMTSMPALLTQVGRCEQSLGLQWFDEDIEHTAQWLNHSYYHFK